MDIKEIAAGIPDQPQESMRLHFLKQIAAMPRHTAILSILIGLADKQTLIEHAVDISALLHDLE